MKRLIQRLVGCFGYEIKRKKAARTHDMDEAFSPIFEKCRSLSSTSLEAKYALYGAINYVIDRDIPGDIVECGVWKGGSCLLAADTLALRGIKDRRVYLYDTFAGMTEPENVDVWASSQEKVYDKWHAMQQTDHNEWAYAGIADVRANLSESTYPSDNFVFVQGKVEDTIPQTVPEQIAILRLDTDWYSSTRHEMEHLFPLLSPGGVLIIDDYGAFEGARKAVDEYLGNNGIRLFLQRLDLSARLAIV